MPEKALGHGSHARNSMKKFLMILTCFATVAAGLPAFGQGQELPQDTGGANPSYPASIDLSEQDEDGWFIGSDQGVLFFVGTSGNFMDLQYYGSVYGGYNFRGIVQPLMRLSQAIGSTEGFFNATTFFFMLEGGLKITPIRTKFRPFFIGTVGFYHLDFNDFGSPIFDDTNFTFTAGGGLEYKFSSSRINVSSEYRGMINDGLDLRGVQVTLGYAFQF
ncbi:porin family protein [Deltaproteobacteria bacterium PRO3]|nr:porin family protein [Deltaproteobacteria bacterium PRO3]